MKGINLCLYPVHVKDVQYNFKKALKMKEHNNIKLLDICEQQDIPVRFKHKYAQVYTEPMGVIIFRDAYNGIVERAYIGRYEMMVYWDIHDYDIQPVREPDWDSYEGFVSYWDNMAMRVEEACKEGKEDSKTLFQKIKNFFI